MLEYPCCSCKQVKPAANFYADKTKKRGYSSQCRECHKSQLKARYSAIKNAPETKLQKQNDHLKYSYGITLRDVIAMREFQNNCCALCGEPFTKKPVVDHNHRTDEVRALVHRKCNTMIGYVETHPNIAALTERYLNNFGR